MYERYSVVFLNGLALDSSYDCIDTSVNLSRCILKYGCAKLAIFDHLQRSLVSINTDTNDIGTAFCVTLSLSCRGRHIVVIADNSFQVIAILCKIIINSIYSFGSIPVTRNVCCFGPFRIFLDGISNTFATLDLCGVTNDTLAMNEYATFRCFSPLRSYPSAHQHIHHQILQMQVLRYQCCQ